MPKHKFKPTSKLSIAKAYIKFYDKKGAFPKSIKSFIKVNKFDEEKFKKHFNKFSQIEAYSVCLLLERTNAILMKDPQMASFTDHEKHLAFLYTLIEQLNNQGTYYHALYENKKTNIKFWTCVQKQCLKVKFDWLKGKIPFTIKGNNIEKTVLKSVLLNHASVIFSFWLFDKSSGKQDTDAFIEKTTHLLFELSDPSILLSTIDLIKFVSTKWMPFEIKNPFNYG